MKKDPKPLHPNSLAAKAEKDPVLKEKIEQGRKKAQEDAQAMEAWAANGFISH